MAGISNLYPHYTDKRFKEPQTVWGAEEEGLTYEYSDRIRQWDYDKAKAASESASAKAQKDTAKWFTFYLSHYYDKPVVLRHIMAGFNVGNGYPYQIFGFRFVDDA